ncbi:hypothetical protein L195_g050265, partial [Trifolium pratense]
DVLTSGEVVCAYASDVRTDVLISGEVVCTYASMLVLRSSLCLCLYARIEGGVVV